MDDLSPTHSKLGLPSSQEDFFLRFVRLCKSFSTRLTAEREREISVELCGLDSDGDLPSIDYVRKRVISQEDPKV